MTKQKNGTAPERAGGVVSRFRKAGPDLEYLAAILLTLPGNGGGDTAEASSEGATGPMARLLAGMQAAQALRAATLPPSCLNDTNWAMIVELMLASLQGRRVSLSRLGAGASVPYTTALSRIRALIDEGLLRGVPDPLDRRRTYIEISPGLAGQIEAYLSHFVREKGVRSA